MPHHTDLARFALRRIAALRLPPTPENYLRFYQEGMRTEGLPEAQAHDQTIVERVEEVVERVSTSTDNLASNLVEQNEGLAAAIKGHVGSPATLHSASFDGLMAAAAEILSIVRASQHELAETKQSLELIKAQLQEDRKILGQDPLTGTENRRSLAAIVNREIAHARQEGAPLAVAMVDVDHFKLINDKYGHAAGDAALIHLANLATSALRGNDALARYGGEEFVLVLPGTAMNGAVFAVRRFQGLLARRPLVFAGNEIPMTFSAGVATLCPPDDQAVLLQRADAALYEAKRLGRNCVVEAASPL